MMRYMTLVALIVWSANVHAVCNNRIDANTPNSRFVDEGDGTVTDTRTGLRWQRCPVGYHLNDNGTSGQYDDDSCTATGTTLFNWQDALQAAADLNGGGGLGGFVDWRVPSVNELASIVEYQCESPAINESIFPDTSTTQFWSSTPRRLIDSAFVIDFGTGASSWNYKDIAGFEIPVRLVRGSP